MDSENLAPCFYIGGQKSSDKFCGHALKKELYHRRKQKTMKEHSLERFHFICEKVSGFFILKISG
jgi:hypothetical protein